MSHDRSPPLKLSILSDTFSICRLPPDAPLPDWARSSSFASITRTSDELSIVCARGYVPEGITVDVGWRCFKVEGPLDLALTGVMAALAAPLAAAGISIFPIATYDTDYLLVKAEDLERATEVLAEHGNHLYSATNDH